MSFRLKDLGPGLLYAGAAIGVSHLVQSTRAGVLFGLDLLLVVLLVNLTKYPFFAVGATYPALTGQNLLWGYKKVGAWALHLFSISHLLSVFVVQAAVTVVTVGVLQVSLLSEVDLKVLNFGFLVLFLLMGRLGKFSFIDHLMKGIVFVLALLTVVAVFMSLTLNPHFSLGVFSITNKSLDSSKMSSALFLRAPSRLCRVDSSSIMSNLLAGANVIELCGGCGKRHCNRQ